jgi:hypothetical protein
MAFLAIPTERFAIAKNNLTNWKANNHLPIRFTHNPMVICILEISLAMPAAGIAFAPVLLLSALYLTDGYCRLCEIGEELRFWRLLIWLMPSPE